MRRFLLTILAVCLTGSAVAAPVDKQKALTVATNFWKQQSGKAGTLKDAAIEKIDGIYIFTESTSGGFVIVSADDCATPILGYSLEFCDGDLTESLPDNMRHWLENIVAEIEHLSALGNDPTPEIARQWHQLLENDGIPEQTAVVGPLITTTWGQNPYYNTLCPYDTVAAERTVAGCVATAMAQVMNYWQRPVVGNGSHCYTHGTYGLLSADFGSTYYAWDDMPAALTASSTATQVDAVATLMYHCGIAVDMDYGLSANGGSGAYTVSNGLPLRACAENALKNYFDYKQTVTGLSRANYTDSAWTAILRNEIDNGRPVLYTGHDVTGGHAFVCDGYDDNNLFHFNWGWRGSYDGYFATDALNPGGSGTGGNATHTYNSNQQVVIGIEPNSSSLRAMPNIAVINGTGDSTMINIRSNNTITAGWSAATSASWLSITPQSGNGGGSQTAMRLTANANTTGRTRIALVIITQGQESDTITVSQPNAGTSTTGWYGNDNYTHYWALMAGDQIIMRPEAFGNFTPGSQLTAVKFTTYNSGLHRNNNFTIKIYEGTTMDSALMASTRTSDISGCLGQTVMSQSYTQRDYGEQTVTLNTPYTIGCNNFWIAVEAADSTAILNNRTIACDTIDFADYPVINYVTTRYLRTATQNSQTWLRYCCSGSYVGNEHTRAIQYNNEFVISALINTDSAANSEGHSDTVIARGQYQWHGTTYLTNGTYLDTVSSLGCEHTDTLRLTIMYSITAASADNTKGWAAFDEGTSGRQGSIVTARATANRGYHFVRWSCGSTANPLRITLRCDTTVVAIFEGNPMTVTLINANSDRGIVTGGGTVSYGSSRRIMATAFNGYRFNGWDDGDTNAIRTITVTSDTTIAATFSPLQYTITATSCDTAQGRVAGSGIYDYRDIATLTATPLSGYRFSQWNDGSTVNPRNITITSDSAFTAYFAAISPDTIPVTPDTIPDTSATIRTLTLLCNNPSMGAVSGGGTYSDGSTARAQAYPTAHHHFITWSDGGTENPRYIVMDTDITLTAHFAVDSVTITVQCNNALTGTVCGSGVYPYGSPVTVSAAASEGWHFVRWNTGSTDNPYTFTATYSQVITAIFMPGTNENILSAQKDGDIRVWASDMAIHVETCHDTHVTILDVLGRCIHKSVQTASCHSYIAPQTGVYIVLTDKKTYKVLVR